MTSWTTVEKQAKINSSPQLNIPHRGQVKAPDI